MQSQQPSTAVLGFPRIGRRRELKFALEDLWRGKATEEQLLAVAKDLRARHWREQQAAGITFIPSNDFSLYDQVLDALVLVGATPSRFGSGPVTLDRYFKMARNSKDQTAMEMTKWFDTNYHYLVPEWTADLAFQPDTTKPVSEFNEAKALGISTRPVIIGPVSLLLLGKSIDGTNPLDLLPKLLDAYKQILTELHQAGAEWVQIDEPSLVTDLNPEFVPAFHESFCELTKLPVKLMLTTYFGDLGTNLEIATSLNTAGLHIDLVRAPEQLAEVLSRVGGAQVLSLGLVEGRNIWLNDLEASSRTIQQATQKLGVDRVQISTSCSLLHAPYTTEDELELDPRVKSWLSFSEQKLAELAALAEGPEAAKDAFADNRKRHEDRIQAESSTNPTVRATVARLEEGSFRRQSPYAERAKVQREELGLPLLPTTTIGSFPQTAEVRSKRAAHKKGHLSDAEYHDYLAAAITDCVRKQEAIGLDVLVHGEFERNDMVEYFGEHLKGFAFTENGWVQSYGSRCVKPPVIFGDVSRPEPMTVKWSSFARSVTDRPMKGMLTGPITILQWSFVRNDIPEKDTAFQIALALRDEVSDLEKAGIRVIQVDEPALREGLPLRRKDWETYLDWAVKAFRLATSSVTDGTQIHTHMCYCEFEDVLPSIAALDADVISMESARSKMEMLNAFQQHGYPNEIGPGVYDIHSPRVPSTEEMKSLLQLALKVLRPDQVWVNPDCGLKTRQWPETTEALTNLVNAAKELRPTLAE